MKEYTFDDARDRLVNELDGAVYYAMNAMECAVVHRSLIALQNAEEEIAELKAALKECRE